jgi:NitT/TauT family transport system permease protein
VTTGTATDARDPLGWIWATLGGLSILLAWLLVVWLFEVRPFIAPSPLEVLRVLWTERLLLLRNLWPTAVEAVCGFALGNAAAFLLATLFVHSKLLERMYFPVAVVFNTVPVIALAPILVLIFGLGMTTKIVIAAIICFFPTLVNAIHGLEAVTPSEMELMRILSASRREVFLKLRLPRSLPFLFAALRIAATTCVIGAIVGEWIGSSAGIGALIIQATFNYRSGLLYAAILASSALALALFAVVVLAERRLVRWR